MKLFESKTNNATAPEVAAIEEQINQLERRKADLIYQIGLIYVQNNDCSSAAGTVMEHPMAELIKMEEEKVSLEKRRLAVQGLRKCEKCGHILDIDSVFCNKCGEKLMPLFAEERQDANVCEKCGTTYAEGSSFCTNCGNKLS